MRRGNALRLQCINICASINGRECIQSEENFRLCKGTRSYDRVPLDPPFQPDPSYTFILLSLPITPEFPKSLSVCFLPEELQKRRRQMWRYFP